MTEQAKRRRWQITLGGVLLLITALGIGLAIGLQFRFLTKPDQSLVRTYDLVDPLPELSNIVAIEASTDWPNYFARHPIPPKHWRALLAAFLPAQRVDRKNSGDDWGSDYMWAGNLWITERGQDPELISFYDAWESDLIFIRDEHYWGGRLDVLNALLNQTHDDHQKSLAQE